MQVLASRGGADEVLLQAVNDYQKSLLKRKMSLFEGTMIETERVDIDDDELLRSLGQIEFGKIHGNQSANANPGANEVEVETPKPSKISSSAQSSSTSSLTNLDKSYSCVYKTKQHCIDTSEAELSVEEALCGRKLDPTIHLGSITHLGKRNRLYLDVWKEQDYIERSKQRHRFEPLSRWTDLLKNYSDNHDGYYRTWMLGQIRPRNRYADPFRKSSQAKEGVKVISPPVPAAVHHPAAWGLHSRTSPSSSKSRFEKVHPAAFTKRKLRRLAHS